MNTTEPEAKLLSWTLAEARTGVLQHTNEADAAFRKLAAGVVDGKLPPPKKIAEVLRDAGRTLEDLEVEAARLQRRRDLRKQVETQPELEKRQAEIRQQIETLDAELEVAETSHEAAVRPLADELNWLAEQLHRVGSARRELVETLDPGTAAEIERLTQEAAAAKSAADEARKKVVGLDVVVEHREREKKQELEFISGRGESSQPGLPAAVQEAVEWVDEARRKLTEAQVQAVEAEKQAVEAEKQAVEALQQLQAASTAATAG